MTNLGEHGLDVRSVGTAGGDHEAAAEHANREGNDEHGLHPFLHIGILAFLSV